MRIVFFGTPEFAVPSLDRLLAGPHEVIAVVTQPDRPRGRSRSTPVPPPVKSRAEAAGTEILQPGRPRGESFLASLRALDPDLGVVVAYGHVLPDEVLAVPRLGMINVHASLLPRFRGAAPIHRAILEGDPETGVTIMQMEAGLDTGPVLARAAIPITDRDTGGSLTDRLAALGAETLGETLSRIAAGTVVPEPQDADRATYAPKIDRAVTRIDWNEPAERCARRMRAFDPTPGAWTTTAGAALKCFHPRVLDEAGAPGAVLRAGEGLVVAAAVGSVDIREVQPAGRPRMTAADWARGRPIEPGAVLV